MTNIPGIISKTADQTPSSIVEANNGGSKDFADILDSQALKYNRGNLNSHGSGQAGSFEERGLFWASDELSRSKATDFDSVFSGTEFSISRNIGLDDLSVIDAGTSQDSLTPLDLSSSPFAGDIYGRNIFTLASSYFALGRALGGPVSDPLSASASSTNSTSVHSDVSQANQRVGIEQDAGDTITQDVEMPELESKLIRELTSRESIQSKSGALSISIQDDEQSRKVIITAVVNDLTDEKKIRDAIENVLTREGLGSKDYYLELHLEKEFQTYLGEL